MSYQISDYAARVVERGQAELARGQLALSLRLPEGYYELGFAGVAANFGLTVAPAPSGPSDPFFGLDTALSWTLAGDAQRKVAIRALKKSGIGVARERLGWSQVEPGLGRWDWDAEHRYDALRRAYRESGVSLLECLNGLPGGIHVDDDLSPGDVIRTGGSMTQLTEQWGDLWAGVEVWNEIDRGHVDPRKYVRALQIVQPGIKRRRAAVPVVAGAFAEFREDYLDRLADAGMLSYADAISIHPYGDSASTREMLRAFRGWAAKRGRPELPIWISESGRAWPRGPARPAPSDDARSARANTIRGALARSERAAAYFPFLFTFYEEQELNYGMTDRALTPLRAFAAYATLVRMLAHATPVAAGGVHGARELYAFERAGTRVWVVYTDRPARLAAPPGMSGSVFGIDGRALGPLRHEIPVPDGLAYVVSVASGAQNEAH